MFSVIIPAYDEERYIEKTLTSLPKNVEVIVVCNGCTDDTFKIAKKYTKKVYNINQRNVSKARNYGAKKARYKDLIFLDADTILTNETLEDIKNISKKDYIGTCKVKPNNYSLFYLLFTNLKNLSLIVNVHNASGIIFCNKNIFNKIQGFNEELDKYENGDFVERARKYARFIFSNKHVITSMRRYERLGFVNTQLFLLKERIFKTKKPYPIIR